MNVLSLQNVVKTYANHRAVNDVSFDVKKGTIFGLLGPNGAGKTSLIRIITTITAADSGQVYLNGQPLNRLHPNDIGYMPEERGLYKKMKVGEQLLYLAQLKGLSSKDAKVKLRHWLEKFEILNWWDKKISDLSKGMSQKVQFIATVVHDPSLIILDEPFSGLDPINANLIKDEIFQLKEKGASILFSTHRMEQVEEICEDIVLINHGKILLYGGVANIKNEFKEHKFSVKYEGSLPESLNFGGYEIVSNQANELIFKGQSGQTSIQLLKNLLDSNVNIMSFNEILPSLNEIFIKKVETSNE
ncbi:MAG: ATP-binding cassette domain-containing protein [Saprospiraceae bacterium]|nr:ATP-binding cassette domain-containing protein [Saprospiraceae bacterium]MBK6667051.1 ATP-binding cassette domain-containing protein [Saprospiraceae bacterium]MBK7697662.1 ATP-binding cassette domain-containing protein [Saprospiraceae bacterium]MBK8826246.1 ATP-binding cassette domain-containing protein [Saprospiraceae bacterium]MBK9584063.1 ATP-binding cassette domain-containing protein [Saprospiraceae bacterium]